MKFELRLEDGHPIIFFTEEIRHDKTVTCYTRIGEHSSSSRAYMRGLPKPITQKEMTSCWALMQTYAGKVLYGLNL